MPMPQWPCIFRKNLNAEKINALLYHATSMFNIILTSANPRLSVFEIQGPSSIFFSFRWFFGLHRVWRSFGARLTLRTLVITLSRNELKLCKAQSFSRDTDEISSKRKRWMWPGNPCKTGFVRFELRVSGLHTILPNDLASLRLVSISLELW